ncbi:hypothetical protein GCM10007170_26760 [Arthrobacter liuii]|uniref:Uncharacterized protein n=1 Tax=Arthrobacter liuii TaxID=1476996 RepID=A0ABQ2AXJ3_9MICC|nr:hypothetical protein GCM10007170_26760 [Arthrobacter liuii]
MGGRAYRIGPCLALLRKPGQCFLLVLEILDGAAGPRESAEAVGDDPVYRGAAEKANAATVDASL